MAKPRLRSPSYPSLTIDGAIERARILYTKERRHPALASTVVSHWGYKQKSSGGLKAVSALKSYGLITDSGSGAERKVTLSDTGLAIVQDERQVSPGRDEVIADAAFKPKIISDIWAKYGKSLPSLETIKHYLVAERSYNPNACGDIIRAYKAAVAWRTKEISEDIEENLMESNVEPQIRVGSQEISRQAAYKFNSFENEEIANIRVSRSCAIRLLADGEYNKKSIEALVAQLKLGLELGTYDDLDDGREDS